MAPVELRRQVADLIGEAISGSVDADEVLTGAPLLDLGLDSLGWLRLIDAVEVAYGIELDLTGSDLRRVTVDHLLAQLREAGGWAGRR